MEVTSATKENWRSSQWNLHKIDTIVDYFQDRLGVLKATNNRENLLGVIIYNNKEGRMIGGLILQFSGVYEQ